MLFSYERFSMILQLVLQLIPVFISGFIIYLTYLLSKTLRIAGLGVLLDLCCLPVRAPALDTFLMFVMQAVSIASMVICTLCHVSNHIVISLDIIYFLSILILVLYHTLKESGSLLIKQA